MAVDIRVPPLGESVSEATIARWLKKVGDAVKADEAIVELETDKVTVEVNAPASGVLAAIKADAGSSVAVGTVLGTVDSVAAQSSTPATKPSPQPSPERTQPQQLPLSPAVRKMVDETGVSPEHVQGSGKDGRLLKGDVQSAIEKIPSSPAPQSPSAPTPKATEKREERVRMSRLRQRIAERLKDAQNTAAILTTFNEVDMTNILALRQEYKDVFEKKHGVKLGFMSFFVKAAINALKEIPAVNASIEGTDVIYKNYYDIGVAVGTEQGLVVPVVRDADALGFSDIEKTIAALGKKARDGKLTVDDLSGGTFTISNGGVYGSLMSTPILNPPQSGILGMHKTMDRPVAIKGTVQIRPMMYLALSYDHRIIDGREAVTFLVRVKDALEDPQRLLLDL